MADFSTQLSETGGVGISTTPPAQDQSSKLFAEGVKVATDLFEKKVEVELEAKQKEVSSALLSQFTQRQLKIADMVGRGTLSAQQARMKWRSNVARAIQTSPELATDILDVHSKLTKTSGLGKTAADQAAEIDTRINAARTRGWTHEFATQEDQYGAMLAMEQFDNQNEMLKRQQQETALLNSQLETRSKTIGIQKGELELNRSLQKHQAEMGLATQAKAYYPKFKSQLGRVIEQVKSGQMTKEQGLLEMQGYRQELQSVVSATSLQAGRDVLTSMMTPLETMYQDAVKVVDGKLSADLYTNQLNQTIASLQLQQMGASKKFAHQVAMSRLFAGTNTMLALEMTLTSRDVLERVLEPDANVPSLFTEEARSITKFVKDSPDSSKLDDMDLQRKTTAVNKILQSFAKYGPVEDKLADAAHMLDYFASPSFQKESVENGIVTKENADNAKRVMDIMYEEKVLPLIQQEFSRDGFTFEIKPGDKAPEGANVRTERGYLTYKQVADKPVLAAVTPAFDGTGVRFVAREDLTGREAEAAQAKALQLNKKVAPKVNKFLHAGAHLSGSTDYRDFYEKSFNSLFSPDPSSVIRD